MGVDEIDVTDFCPFSTRSTFEMTWGAFLSDSAPPDWVVPMDTATTKSLVAVSRLPRICEVSGRSFETSVMCTESDAASWTGTRSIDTADPGFGDRRAAIGERIVGSMVEVVGWLIGTVETDFMPNVEDAESRGGGSGLGGRMGSMLSPICIGNAGTRRDGSGIG